MKANTIVTYVSCIALKQIFYSTFVSFIFTTDTMLPYCTKSRNAYSHKSTLAHFRLRHLSLHVAAPYFYRCCSAMFHSMSQHIDLGWAPCFASGADLMSFADSRWIRISLHTRFQAPHRITANTNIFAHRNPHLQGKIRL